MQTKSEEIEQAVQILTLTVNMIAESLNAFTVAIQESNSQLIEHNNRLESLEEWVKHEQ